MEKKYCAKWAAIKLVKAGLAVLLFDFSLSCKFLGDHDARRSDLTQRHRGKQTNEKNTKGLNCKTMAVLVHQTFRCISEAPPGISGLLGNKGTKGK